MVMREMGLKMKHIGHIGGKGQLIDALEWNAFVF